ncbi:hypothetical protein D3C84_624570 [compost metagenome]
MKLQPGGHDERRFDRRPQRVRFGCNKYVIGWPGLTEIRFVQVLQFQFPDPFLVIGRPQVDLC